MFIWFGDLWTAITVVDLHLLAEAIRRAVFSATVLGLGVTLDQELSFAAY